MYNISLYIYICIIYIYIYSYVYIYIYTYSLFNGEPATELRRISQPSNRLKPDMLSTEQRQRFQRGVSLVFQVIFVHFSFHRTPGFVQIPCWGYQSGSYKEYPYKVVPPPIINWLISPLLN